MLIDNQRRKDRYVEERKKERKKMERSILGGMNNLRWETLSLLFLQAR